MEEKEQGDEDGDGVHDRTRSSQVIGASYARWTVKVGGPRADGPTLVLEWQSVPEQPGSPTRLI